MDMKKVQYVTATTKQIAIMTNEAMRRSKKFTNAVFKNNLLNMKKTKFNTGVVKDLYQTSECYDKKGNVTKKGRVLLKKYLEEAGLPENATLWDVMFAIIKNYK